MEQLSLSSNFISVKIVNSLLTWADQPNAIEFFLGEKALDFIVKHSLSTTSEEIKQKLSLTLLHLLQNDANCLHFHSVVDKISVSILHLSNSTNMETLRICSLCLLHLSTVNGLEQRTADGGGLLALSALAPADDVLIMRNCAATLFNLACSHKSYDGLDRVARILLCLASQEQKSDVKTLTVWAVCLCSRFPVLCPKLVEDGGFSLAVSSVSMGACSFPDDVSPEFIAIATLHNMGMVASLRSDLANKACGKMLALLSKSDDEHVLLLIVKTTFLLIQDDVAMSRLVHDGVVSTLVKISTNSSSALIDCIAVSCIARISKSIGHLRYLQNAGAVSLISYLWVKPYFGQDTLLSFTGSCRNMSSFLHNFLLNVDRTQQSGQIVAISQPDVEKMLNTCLLIAQSGLLVSEEDFSACSLSLLRLVRLGNDDYILTQVAQVTKAISMISSSASSVVVACSAATLIGLLVLGCEKKLNEACDSEQSSKILSLVMSYAFEKNEGSHSSCKHASMRAKNTPEMVLLVLRLTETATSRIINQLSQAVIHELIMASNSAISFKVSNATNIKENIDFCATSILVKASKVDHFKELMSCPCVFENIMAISNTSENLITRYQCAQVMSNLSLSAKSKENMMRFEIVSIIDTLSFTSHQDTHFQCALILKNLASDASLHRELIRQNIENSIMMLCLVRSISIPTKTVCAMAIAFLVSGIDEVVKSVVERGGIKALAELSRQESVELADLCAYCLLSLTKSEVGRLELSQSRQSMKSLFSISQSSSFLTRRMCGYAVCQLMSFDDTRNAAIHAGGLLVLKHLAICCSDDAKMQEMCCWGMICGMKAMDIFFNHARRNEISAFLVVNLSRLSKNTVSSTMAAIALLSGCHQLRQSLVDGGCAIGVSGIVLSGGIVEECDAEHAARTFCQLSVCSTCRSFLTSANVILSCHLLCRQFSSNKTILFLSCATVAFISWTVDCRSDLTIQGGLEVLSRAATASLHSNNALTATEIRQRALVFHCIALTLFNLSGERDMRQLIVDSSILGHAITCDWKSVIGFMDNQFFHEEVKTGEAHNSLNDTLLYIVTAISRISEEPTMRIKLALPGMIECLQQLSEMVSESGKQQCASIVANLTDCERCRELLSHEALIDLIMDLSDSDNSFTQKCCFDATSNLSSSIRAAPGLIGNMLTLAQKLNSRDQIEIKAAGRRAASPGKTSRPSSRLKSLLSGGVFRMVADNKSKKVVDEPVDTSSYEKEGKGRNSEYVSRRIRIEFQEFQTSTKDHAEEICRRMGSAKFPFQFTEYCCDDGNYISDNGQASSSIFAAVDEFPTDIQPSIINDFSCEVVSPPMFKIFSGLSFMNEMLERAKHAPERNFSVASSMSLHDVLESNTIDIVSPTWEKQKRRGGTANSTPSQGSLPSIQGRPRSAGRRAKQTTT